MFDEVSNSRALNNVSTFPATIRQQEFSMSVVYVNYDPGDGNPLTQYQCIDVFSGSSPGAQVDADYRHEGTTARRKRHFVVGDSVSTVHGPATASENSESMEPRVRSLAIPPDDARLNHIGVDAIGRISTRKLAFTRFCLVRRQLGRTALSQASPACNRRSARAHDSTGGQTRRRRAIYSNYGPSTWTSFILRDEMALSSARPTLP
ncbi:uncharacterized protein [Dermacentor albipictus]|uniref:uncharacterized protein isoform X2 n=1 Tax=Dermacentor albipictus TaxID=60249 RepID=UPI0038FCD332